MKQIEIIVNAIRATVRKGTAIPGDYIVNQTEGQPLTWISRAELQNHFLSQDKPVPPIHTLKKARLIVEQHEITQEMIDASIANGDKAMNSRGLEVTGYLITINGRPTVFTKPGIKNVLKDVDMRNCDFSESKISELKTDTVLYELQSARTKAQVSQRELRSSLTTPPVRTSAPEEVEEIADEPNEMDTTHTNLDATGGNNTEAVDEADAEGELVEKEEPVMTPVPPAKPNATKPKVRVS